MCDKRYDLDCLDGIDDILQADGKSACRGAVEAQVIPTHNNNTQLLSRQQSGQQQNEHSQSATSSQQVNEKVAPVVSGESGIESLKTSAPQSSANFYQASSKVANPVEQTTGTATSSMSPGRNENLMTCMLITANVGTIFEEATLLDLWFEQLKSYLIKIKPQLVAIHCQEVGGKNFETSMKNVSSFTDKILGDDTIIGDYSRVRIFLDENFECLEKFTALGSLYLFHDSVDNVKLYNFKTAQYDTIEGRDILAAPHEKDLLGQTRTSVSNNVDQEQKQRHKSRPSKLAEHVEKIKFPLELFPECRWSRKGFMRTRWLLNDCQPLDLVNIHLFHDASNLVAMETTPSPYAQNRQKALEFALKRIAEPLHEGGNNNNQRGQSSQNLTNNSSSSSSSARISGQVSSESQALDQLKNQVPMFIFGDFNFRLNTSKVIQRITEGILPVVKKNANSEVLEIIYQRKTSDCTKNPVCNECDKQACATTNTVTYNEDNGNGNGNGNDNENEAAMEDEDGGVLMTVGKKLFDYRKLDETFRATKNTEWLLELDNELDSFKNQLHEFKISFSPSYPFKEDQSGGYSYMRTRCPAWCDRILFNEAGNRIISSRTDRAWPSESEAALDSEKRMEILQNHGDVIYRLMGNSVPMGDHKPVLLFCYLNISQQQHEQQRQLRNPSSKCNQTLMSAMNSGPQVEDNLVESTAM